MYKIIFAFSIVFLLAISVSAEIIFEDGFESDASDWVCSDGQLSKWSSGYMSCESTVGFGDEWKIGTGYNSNNAVYSWKKNGVPNGFRGESNKWLYTTDLKQEIYYSWDMKVPTAANYDKTASAGFKFWRYLGREDGYATPPQILIQGPTGGKFSEGDFQIYAPRLWDAGTGSGYRVLTPISDFNDGTWHHHEIRLKWNAYGSADGIIEYWLDGVKKASWIGLDLSDQPDTKFHKFGIGIGNTSDEAWDQTDWSAIAFDNVVVSTEYIGESSGGSQLGGNSQLFNLGSGASQIRFN